MYKLSIKIIFFLLFILSCFVFLFSCRKDKSWATTYIRTETEPIQLFDKLWILYDGKVFLENLDNGTRTYYDHFTSLKNISNLNIIEGSVLPIDNIEIHKTNWIFNSNKTFTLNDSLTYELSTFNYAYAGSLQIYGLENGSARPLERIKTKSNSFTFKIHEAYQSDGTYNYKYFSYLTFVADGSICDSCLPKIPVGYTYGGVLPSFNPVTSNNLTGSKWIITRFDEGMSPYYPNDTLEFITTEVKPKFQAKSMVSGDIFFDYLLRC